LGAPPMDAIELDESPIPERLGGQLSPLDIDAAMLALTGGSVVDWSRLRFRTHEDVHRFLRLWHCDITQHLWARERLRYLYNQAINYLEDHVGLSFPTEVRRPRDIREAFLRASMRTRFSRNGILYCAVLKLIHVINHLEMQELRTQLPIREVDLIEHTYNVVIDRAHRMRADGFPLHAFYGNRKSRPSTITKLLAKRESTAAAIYDKLRFRIVTEAREDLVPALAWLTRNLVPFPTITPGESFNNLLGPAELAGLLRQLPDHEDLPPPPSITPNPNPYSGQVFRMINFIAAIPIRVYDLPGVSPPERRALLGEAVPVSVELQLVDAETDRANESGDNRHELYKRRQLDRVYQRLGRRPTSRRD
jgi:uncharacterized protein (TIGR04552 family)